MVSKSYRPDIDGLRAVAVSIVVGFHAGLLQLSGGFVGVDIFFVISGFLICAIIHREVQDGAFSFRAFYARRAKRILPPLFLVLFCCYILAALVMTSAEMNDFSRSALANITGTSNIYFLKTSNYFSTSAELKPLMMTWSLSVEEQFYACFPIILLLLKRFKVPLFPVVALMTILSFAISIRLTGRNPSAAFFSIHARAWELGVGALLAIQQSRSAAGHTMFNLSGHSQNFLGWGGAAMLTAAVALFDNTTRFPGAAAALPVLGAAFIIASPDGHFNRRLLSCRPVVFVGLVSYSWYLWHWPLLSFARLISDRQLTLNTSLPIVAVAFLLAVLSWRFVEQPFRQSRHGNNVTLRRYGAATAIMLACAGAMVLSDGWPHRLSNEFVSIERSSVRISDPCLAEYGDVIPNISDRCTANSSADAIALIGDSHSSALAPAFRAMAHESGLSIYEFTKSSCPTLDGTARPVSTHPHHEMECVQFNQRALALVLKNQSIKTVALAGYWSATGFRNESDYANTSPANHPLSQAESSIELQHGVSETVRLLQAKGKKVILIQDVPIFNFDPVRSIALKNIPARHEIASLLGLLSYGDGQTAPKTGLMNPEDPSRALIDNVARSNPGVTVLDPWTTLCQRNRCSYSDGSQMYYTDSQHLSAAGARLALDVSSIKNFVSR